MHSNPTIKLEKIVITVDKIRHPALNLKQKHKSAKYINK